MSALTSSKLITEEEPEVSCPQAHGPSAGGGGGHLSSKGHGESDVAAEGRRAECVCLMTFLIVTQLETQVTSLKV